MPNQELLRIVDGIARDKNIDRDQIYTDIEQAIASALRKQFNTEDASEFVVKLDRQSGDLTATRLGAPIPLNVLGRIAAQTAKQVMIQLIRQDERGSIYDEFKDRVGAIVTGTVARFEGGAMIVSLGRVEAIMPKSEQIPGEAHQVGERVQAMVLEVRDTPSAVKIILSRSHPEFIRRLFEREVPEVGEKTIELKALAREPGHRTKIAVSSIDSKVDAVGACVGVRGSRIKNIVDELGGEKIDIVRWNESSQILISNALKPAEVAEVSLCFELGRATVVVNEDQLSLAIGKRGQNVRLAARLTGWDIDILTPVEFQGGVQRLDQTLKSIEGITQEVVDKTIALGLIDVRDIEEVGVEPLMEELGLEEAVAKQIVERCAAEAKIVAVEQEQKKAQAASAKASATEVRDAQDEAVLRALGLRGVDAEAGSAPVPQPSATKETGGTDTESQAAAEDDAAAEAVPRMPVAMESTDGSSPEVTVHKEAAVSAGEELSPEEKAVKGSGVPPEAGDEDRKEFVDEDTDTAALVEGRAQPPKTHRDEPK